MIVSEIHIAVREDRADQLGDGHRGSYRHRHPRHHERSHQPEGQTQDSCARANGTVRRKLPNAFIVSVELNVEVIRLWDSAFVVRSV